MSQLIKVAQKKDIPLGKGKSIEVEGKMIAIFNIDNQIFAMDDTCTHAGASLAEGVTEGHKVTCPWHSAEFDIKTGQALCAPAFEHLKTYKVEVVGDDINIQV